MPCILYVARQYHVLSKEAEIILLHGLHSFIIVSMIYREQYHRVALHTIDHKPRIGIALEQLEVLG
jgi:hypothetical protein